MKSYIMLALMIAGGLGLSFVVSFAFYFQEQSNKEILHKYCPNMQESCLDGINIEPVLPTLTALGLGVYLVLCCQKILSIKQQAKPEVEQE